MATKKRPLKVFLCHAKEDKPKVREVYRDLTSNGIDAWLDEVNLLPGQDWRIEIPKVVREADVVVVCMSSASARKEGFVQAEINFALDKALEKPEGMIYIIPAKLEECIVPDKLSRWQWVNLFENDGYKKLLEALKLCASGIDGKSLRTLVTENLETVQLILDGKFSEFNGNRQDDLVVAIAALLRVDKSSIRVLRVHPGSIIMEIELTKIGANRLLDYFEKGDIRLKSLDIISVRLLEVEKKTRKGSIKPYKTSKKPQVSEASKVNGGNQSIVILGDVIGSNVVTSSKNKVRPSGKNVNGSGTEMKISTRSRRLVPDRVLGSWLNGHDMIANPFGNVDLKSYPFYPEGTARPNQWDAFMDPVPLFALCLTSEDAEALSYLLRKECLLSKEEDSVTGINRRIFPLWISHQQTAPVQSPLLTLAQSAAQAWLGILPISPDALLGLSPAKQDALLEQLHWVIGSNNAIINLLQINGLQEDAVGLSLIRKIDKFEKELSIATVPQDAILSSWLNIKPFGFDQTYLIFPGDDLLLVTPKWWFEQFASLIPLLFLNRIVTKVIASTTLPISLPFQEIELSWSDGLNGWLNRSLQGQFDAALDPEVAKSMGVATRFHELFGPGTTEEQTTAKLVSASHNSLARMLILGNRLLQYHCEKRGVSDKYLYVEDLEAILKMA